MVLPAPVHAELLGKTTLPSRLQGRDRPMNPRIQGNLFVSWPFSFGKLGSLTAVAAASYVVPFAVLPFDKAAAVVVVASPFGCKRSVDGGKNGH